MKYMTGIYKYTNKFNRKVYIGKSSNITRRKTMHKTNAKAGMKGYFYNALRKYGIENFDFEVLIECPLENLNYWETFYIKYYCANDINYGYNLTKGGDGVCGVKRSKEAIEKAAEGAKSWWSIKKNHDKMSEKHKGHPGYNKGMEPWNKGLSKEEDERLQSISKKNSLNSKFGICGMLNKHHKEESKEKIRISNLNKPHYKSRLQKWMNNGLNNKRVNPEEIEYYKSLGYSFGKMIKKNK